MKEAGATEMLNNQTSDRQHVWIVRYGMTEFPLLEGVGPYDSKYKFNFLFIVYHQVFDLLKG